MALPGTEEKIRVLIGRAARNELLWHSLDRRWDQEVDWEKMNEIVERNKERLDAWKQQNGGTEVFDCEEDS
jgi:hypothetical protein